jgi:2-polyprenyl-3-methyl-5-hydroxy-6-metoxy-1,4-benzoquinol methylase
VFLVNRWLPAVPGLVERLNHGIRVADIGCGTGTVAILMAESYPNSVVTGFDVSEDSIAVAGERAGDLPNVEFHGYAVEEVPTTPPFDLITTFDVIHDLPDPRAGLSRIRDALADDGVYLMMEPNVSSYLEDNLHDRGALLYGVSALHCMTQSLAVGGEGVGAAWGWQRAERYATEAGFSSFERLEEITNRFSAFYLLRR